MSDTKENKEASQGAPSAVDENHELVDAQVEVQPEVASDSHPVLVENVSLVEGQPEIASDPVFVENVSQVEGQPEVASGPVLVEKVSQIASDPVLVEKVSEDEGQPDVASDPVSVEDVSNNVEKGSNHFENGSDNLESESNHVEHGKEEPPAEDTNVNHEAVLEDIPQEDVVQDALHSVPVEAAEDTNVNHEVVSEDIPQEDVVQDALHSVSVEAAEDTNVNHEAVSEDIPQEDVHDALHSVTVETAEDTNVNYEAVSEDVAQEDAQDTLHSVPVEADAQMLNTIECEAASEAMAEAEEFPQSNKDVENDDNVHQNGIGDAEMAVEVKPEVCEAAGSKTCDYVEPVPSGHVDSKTFDNVDTMPSGHADTKTCDNVDHIPSGHKDTTTLHPAPADTEPEIKNVLEVVKADEKQAAEPADNGNSNPKNMFFLDADHFYDGNESGTEEDQSAFMKELENFFRERSMEFKPPKFYGEGLNCLKLWRAVTRLGGYDKVTSCKLWRQVGESFKPPKTCTTVSWTFRGFYEKALLDYERHNIKGGELNVPIASHPEPMNIENQASVSGRARRDAAARAMQGWHSQRLLGNGEVSDPIIKDRNPVSVPKREKQLKSINLLKRKKPSYMDNAVKAARSKPSKPQLDTAVIDIGPPADWVKVNVQRTKDSFEVYALVPGLLREEVRVQSDPAGRLVISGEPEHPNNPWGVTPFKKVVSLPSRIDPHQTSAVVTLHGQLFVRVPYEQSE